MSHDSLAPVFVGLRTGLHLLVAVLLGVVVVRIVVEEPPGMWVALSIAAVFGAVYFLGALVVKVPDSQRAAAGVAWVLALTLLWVGLLAYDDAAAYLAFPLFFLYLHVLPRVVGPLAVLGCTLIAIVALGLHTEFTVAGVVGPVIGAGVAVLIDAGYRALAREATEREALLAELIRTRDQLAETEREQGALAERARLAREIHDTIAQGLSSIQMLLHAAAQAAPDSPGVEHVRLARQTAVDALADTRRFIRELSPPALDGGLAPALLRVASTQASISGVDITVDAPRSVDLPMDVQTALLRIVQGALANVIQHAQASTVQIILTEDAQQVTLSVADDGVGYDTATAQTRVAGDSFGLRAIEERVGQLGGVLRIDSSAGHGTVVTVIVPRTQP